MNTAKLQSLLDTLPGLSSLCSKLTDDIIFYDELYKNSELSLKDYIKIKEELLEEVLDVVEIIDPTRESDMLLLSTLTSYLNETPH